jgi:hypothetical protein
MPSLLDVDFILSTRDFTSEYASVVNLYRTCKSLRDAFAGHQAAPCTLAFMRGLYERVRVRCPSFVLSPSSFECYNADRDLAFVVRIEGVRSMRVCCTGYKYITEIREIYISGGFICGVFDYTNLETGDVVLSPFEFPESNPWFIHGIPRNLENTLRYDDDE